jgi:hypothetical protein
MMENNVTGTNRSRDLGCVRILAHMVAGANACGLRMRAGGMSWFTYSAIRRTANQ